LANTILYVIDSEKYFEKVVDIFRKDLSGKTVIYITTNKPYKNMVSLFQKEKIGNRIFFIDCISKTILGDSVHDEGIDNCIFVESPQSLTAISIAINESMKHITGGGRVLFLDSLSTLMIYNDASTVGKFSNFIINKMSTFGVDIIVLSLDSDIDKDIMKKIKSFVEEVRYTDGQKK
jgi:KaiC/GvpD/RAD55 family RecA-like ATPase